MVLTLRQVFCWIRFQPSHEWLSSPHPPELQHPSPGPGGQYSHEPPASAHIYTILSRPILSDMAGMATVRVGIEAGPITRRAYGAQADAAMTLGINSAGDVQPDAVGLVSGLRAELVTTFPLTCGSRPLAVINAIASPSAVRDGYVELIARITYVRFTLTQPYPCY